MGSADRDQRRDDQPAAHDRPVRRFLERIAGPAAGATPDLAAIGEAIVDLAADVDYWTPWVQRLRAAPGSVVIHGPERGPRLSLVHRSEGRFGALHDHGTWVAIAPVVGCETHRRYRIEGADQAALPRLTEVRALVAGDLVTLLPPDDIHDHGHLTGAGDPAYVLIMTGDDQRRFTRNEWDPTTGRHRLLLPGDPGRWLATEPMSDA